MKLPNVMRFLAAGCLVSMIATPLAASATIPPATSVKQGATMTKQFIQFKPGMKHNAFSIKGMDKKQFVSAQKLPKKKH